MACSFLCCFALATLWCAGITMASTSTRRSPNCFNLLRQMHVLSRAGAAAEATTVALDLICL